ncbi:MAG: xanthine dehydrogenase family protein molybdopterin-binding subunit [Planctomycetota bacterium]|nr:MAG: xanthine dehydrogenase family protein molybdopterin-binding subunit [Planctomycetota bacterium]REJ97410.1 MAG: xanthine dehydrogenase family protein molybdopterin-binding subunit [Planctomycetota bacterium]
MANVQYQWPSASAAQLLGTRQRRLDGADKSTGAAKYTYDVNLPKQLIVKALDCPHAHCRIKSIDTSAARRVPGVVHVHVIKTPKKDADGNTVLPEVLFQGELLVAVAAETEGAAAEGVGKLKVEYEVLEPFVSEEELDAAVQAQRAKEGRPRVSIQAEPDDDVEDEEQFENDEIERLFREAKYVVEGYYGIDAITHCCLEPHGTTLHWQDGRLVAYLSTQNVSGCDDGFAAALDMTADDVDVHCEYIGGGFGSKFRPDYWGIAAAEISKKTGRPVKFMLERDQELMIAGNRPSGYLNVKLGADEKGVVQIWDSAQWGTSGVTGGGVADKWIPYVYEPPNYRRRSTFITTNTDQSRAWRAPNHPQACAMSQTAYDDLAAKMGANSYDIFERNLKHISSRQKAEVYAEEMKIGARLMDWQAKWHPHGKGPRRGSVVDGLGMAIHMWGGGANASTCQVKIHPDGGVESYCGTQDLGTGTRTICAMVLAETFGLPISAVNANIGTSKFPFSGASGGSTTVGAVAESHRRAGQDALAQLCEKVGEKLGVKPASLVAAAGRIHVAGKPDEGLSWREACSLLVMRPLEVTATFKRGQKTPLSDEGVGGVQMAHVEVDTATGQVRVKKIVAVQDMGLVLNPQTAESQIYGGVIMGIAYSLFEQRIMDPKTGAFLNSNLANYRLPRLGDVGEIVVEIYEPPDQRERGVIGLGEPPVISGGAAISNAVCNATGVRVPVLPMTPDRVLAAIKSQGRASS